MRKWSRYVRPAGGASKIELSNSAGRVVRELAGTLPKFPSGVTYNKASSLALHYDIRSEGQILRFLDMLPEMAANGSDPPWCAWAMEILSDGELGAGVKLALLEDAIRRGDQAAGTS
jgi:hypothetical protein